MSTHRPKTYLTRVIDSTRPKTKFPRPTGTPFDKEGLESKRSSCFSPFIKGGQGEFKSFLTITRVYLVLILIAGLLSGCGKSQPYTDILTTTGMIADATQHIAGEKFSVSAMMGSGVDPHTYKATAGDVARLKNAKIIFYNGLHLEAKLSDILQKMDKPTLAVGESLDKNTLLRLENFPGEVDPHIWFDITLWQKISEHITEKLSEFDPKNAANYREKLAAYQKELTELDHYVRTQAQRIPTESRILVTAHDAFGYFGRAYGFRVVGLQGTSTASEAGAKDVQNLADLIVSNKIRAIFVESSVPRRHIEAVQQAVKAKGWDVKIGGELFSDAMGAPGTPEGTYIGMIRHNIDTITQALAPL